MIIKHKMDKFGFAISKGRQIDWDANSRKVADFIREKEPSFKLCIACGGCAATCTAGDFTDFSLRELNVLIHRGENIKPKDDIKKCMLCGKCSLVCPRGVNTRNVVFLAKQAFQKFNGHAV
jgi:heterodisulfide reductase subunit C